MGGFFYDHIFVAVFVLEVCPIEKEQSARGTFDPLQLLPERHTQRFATFVPPGAFLGAECVLASQMLHPFVDDHGPTRVLGCDVKRGPRPPTASCDEHVVQITPERARVNGFL
tara:strand:+ start:208 stop:546 length:339 start_codon:yes stop_codon:yes gene_type:complete